MSKMLGDVFLIVFVYNAIYVEDVEDRSNTPKGCNAMYVEDVKDRSNTPKGVMLCMSKMSKIDQIHLRL